MIRTESERGVRVVVLPCVRRDDAFPACRALRRWPTNCPVGERADLVADEEAEVTSERFAYLEVELECWAGIVRDLLVAVVGPRLGR